MVKPRSILIALIPTLVVVAFVIVLAWSDNREAGTQISEPTFVDGATYRGVEITGIILLSEQAHATAVVTDEFFDSSEHALALSQNWAPSAQVAKARTGVLALLQLPDGKWFAGDVVGGEPNGWGVFSQPNGTKLEGKWRYGIPYRVSGRVVLPDGTVEDGTWDYIHGTGNGTITWRDGHTYQGSWKIAPGYSPELPEGTGTMAWPDGHTYVGRFLDGQMHGWGTMTQSDGKVVDGLWRHGEFALSRIAQ